MVKQTGFTLLELLIAMALLSVIMLLIFGTLRIGARSWEAGEKKAETMSQVVIVEDFLRNHLTRVQPWVDDFSEDEPVFMFQGTHEGLLFVSTLPLHNRGQGGWHTFNLKLVEKRDQTDLVVALDSFYPSLDEDNDAKIDDVLLIEGVDSIALSYFGSETPNEEPEWFETWEDKNFLPQMIRIAIQVRGRQPWPVLLVAPRMAVSAQLPL